MKAGTFPKKNNPPIDKKGKGNPNNQNDMRNQRSNGHQNQERDNRDLRGSAGPTTYASGPFTEGQ